jgi:hypothetical protein
VTSVPTWLAVVIPILAALVSGSAGVVGALLGGGSATRTAERNAALARQDEQRRWNRERREKAYITLLDRRNQLVELKRAWDEGDPDGLGRSLTDIKEYSSEQVAAEQALGEALAVVELAGSERALDLARTWVCVLGERRVKGEEELFGDPIEREKEWRDQFVGLIREELGVDD